MIAVISEVGREWRQLGTRRRCTVVRYFERDGKKGTSRTSSQRTAVERDASSHWCQVHRWSHETTGRRDHCTLISRSDFVSVSW